MKEANTTSMYKHVSIVSVQKKKKKQNISMNETTGDR